MTNKRRLNERIDPAVLTDFFVTGLVVTVVMIMLGTFAWRLCT